MVKYDLLGNCGGKKALKKTVRKLFFWEFSVPRFFFFAAEKVFKL
jgi:hypothetical protein